MKFYSRKRDWRQSLLLYAFIADEKRTPDGILFYGGRYRIRTCDLYNVNVAL